VLLTCCVLFAGGLAIALTGFGWPALAVASAAVFAACLGHAAVTDGVSWPTVPNAYGLLTVLQVGYLAGTGIGPRARPAGRARRIRQQGPE